MDSAGDLVHIIHPVIKVVNTSVSSAANVNDGPSNATNVGNGICCHVHTLLSASLLPCHTVDLNHTNGASYKPSADG